MKHSALVVDIYIYKNKYLGYLQIIGKWLRKGDGRMKTLLRSKIPDVFIAAQNIKGVGGL